MTLNEYQMLAMGTCMETCENVPYMLLNLQGEVGELSGKIAKLIRKDRIEFNSNLLSFTEKMCGLSRPEIDEIEDGIKGELGDVLWQLSGLCRVMGYDLEEIAQMNLDKLASRRDRGVIDGEGDNR